MVYSCPETASDVYVNQKERQQKKGREGGQERERREREEGGRREEFAKMPSYGSLQQAVKVRPKRGEKEKTSLGL